ncbi:aspartate kinase [Thiohalorhabdus denitrificans]|uniref:Aspartokinase n=1 Tax=Thiohalorhabdus denitrificans TaxID=381306 RepID=A0A0P9CCF0_9GAMM|nr:aspartate kinase [Thiohalorhabdus denitrificans]KPV40567.1 aspartate kinase [Thiohalorhabdus denitrificans]SCY51092.1 aspartate kinase [Thiohalorhabdus denitrificans]
MALIVQKFGGSSLADVGKIRHAAERVLAERERGNDVVVVVSAMGGQTDDLVEMAEALHEQPPEREMDQLLATGEQVTISLMAMALQQRGHASRSFAGWQVPVHTDDVHTKARIHDIDRENLRAELEAGGIPVVAGFQGLGPDGSVTTLGRGGSDTTAVALAAALEADECHIYTDVDGVYTTDPRIVADARRLDKITFEEMIELASLGAKVLQIRAVEFAGKYNVPVRVRSTFGEGEGTLITVEEEAMEKALVSGIAHNEDEAKVTIIGVPDRPGIAHAVIGAAAKASINVDMIIQNQGEHGKTDFTFTVPRSDYKQVMEVLDPVCKEIEAEALTGSDRIAKISVVGVGMRNHAGVADRMFEALSNEGVNIQMIATSEIKVSVVVDQKYTELAVRALHEAFELDKPVEERDHIH